MKPTFFAVSALLLATSLSPVPVARANMACHEGGPVTQSENGRVSLTVSAYGCQAYPSSTYTVSGGRRTFQFDGPSPDHSEVLVSNTGRSVLFLEENPRADRASITLFRDGAQHGTYALADLLGAQHTYVTDALYVKVALDGLEVVIRDLQDGELNRIHLRDFRFQS